MQDISSTTAVYSDMRFYKTEVILILIIYVGKEFVRDSTVIYCYYTLCNENKKWLNDSDFMC